MPRFEDALSTIRSGKYDEGIILLTELIQDKATRIEALGHRAWLFRSLGRLNEALCDYDTLVAENPCDLYGATIRAETLLLLGKKKEAITAAAEVLRLEPTNDYVFKVFSKCRQSLGLSCSFELEGSKHNYLTTGLNNEEMRYPIPRFPYLKMLLDRWHFPSRYSYYEYYLKSNVKNKRVIDIGAMWLVNGRFSFFAEECGAKEVIALDIMSPTSIYLQELDRRRSKVQFIQGDIMDENVASLGKFDVVFCCGVIYHLPDPCLGIHRIKSLTKENALIGSAIIKEGIFRNRAVYYPYLDTLSRKWWNFGSKDRKIALNAPYSPLHSYANWFWGMSPSCIASLLYTNGFDIKNIHYRPHFAFFECSVSE